MESISLEETNKHRIALGLKPLVDDRVKKSTPTLGAGASDAPPASRTKDEEAEDNYRRKREEDKRAREAQDSRSRLEKLRNRRLFDQRLAGPTLGADEPVSRTTPATSESDEASTRKWLKQQRKRAKLNAERLAKDREEAEVVSMRALQRSYGEQDVAGMRVAHDLDELRSRLGGDGQEVTLTLKDSNVLDDREDELVESSLAHDERAKVRAERAKGAQRYTGLDDDEFGDSLLPAPASNMGKPAILTKYDGDLDRNGMLVEEEEPKGFVLGSTAVIDRAQERRKQHEEAAAARNRTLVDLHYDKNQMASDYLQPGEPGFKIKKPKKKRKATKVRLDDLDDAPQSVTAPEAMDLDDAVLPARSRYTTGEPGNVVDDDELAFALARTRRHKAKRVMNKTTPEMIAKNLAAQKKAEEEAAHLAGGIASVAPPDLGGVEVKPEVGQEGGPVTFDATSEFVRHLRSRQTEAQRDQSEVAERRQRLEQLKSESGDETRSTSGPTAEQQAMDAEMADLEQELKVQREAEDEAARVQAATPSHSAEPEQLETKDEPLVSRGLAATLSVLRNSNALEAITPEQLEKEKVQRQQDIWLAQRKLEAREEEEERRRNKTLGDRKDQATRERENREREAMAARLAMERFADYKPDVAIKYHDSSGRELNVKEAWKDLSHKFHGTNPGFRAQERLMRKRELQLQQERMAAGDTPSGLATAFNMRAERTGQAHMILSVGNRGNAPRDWDLGASSVTASEPSRGGGNTGGSASKTAPSTTKIKNKGGAAPEPETLPVLGEESSSKRRKHASASTSVPSAPASEGIASLTPRAAFKPGFAPVRASASPAPSQPSSTSMAGSLKIALGKRKAPDTGE